MDQYSHDFAAHFHGFATKTNALAREIPPATQAKSLGPRLTRTRIKQLNYSQYILSSINKHFKFDLDRKVEVLIKI